MNHVTRFIMGVKQDLNVCECIEIEIEIEIYSCSSISIYTNIYISFQGLENSTLLK